MSAQDQVHDRVDHDRFSNGGKNLHRFASNLWALAILESTYAFGAAHGGEPLAHRYATRFNVRSYASKSQRSCQSLKRMPAVSRRLSAMCGAKGAFGGILTYLGAAGKRYQ
jgi:hypothetical protein